MSPDTPTRRNRNNRLRGKRDELEVAKIIGGKRYPANTGGPGDIEHSSWAVQCKGRAAVPDYIRDGVASARVAALGTTKLPVLVLVDRSGTRVQRYAIVPLEEFAAEFGCEGVQV
jgi:hypothetical protein